MGHRDPPRASLITSLATLTLAGSAFAACPPPAQIDPARVDERVSAAVAAEQALRPDEALGAYVDALRAVPWSDDRWRAVGAAIALQLARRYEMLQRLPEARDAYRCFVHHTDDDHPDRAVALGRIAALEATLAPPPTLTIRALPPQSRLMVDGQAVGAGPWSARVEPGRHTVEAAAEGFVPDRRTLDVIADVTVELALTPQARLRVEADGPGWRARLGDAEPTPLPLERLVDPGPRTLVLSHVDGSEQRLPLELVAGERRTLMPAEAGFDAPTFMVIAGTVGVATGGALAVGGLVRDAEAERLDLGGAATPRVDALEAEASALYLAAGAAAVAGVAAIVVGWSLIPDGATPPVIVTPGPGGATLGGHF